MLRLMHGVEVRRAEHSNKNYDNPASIHRGWWIFAAIRCYDPLLVPCGPAKIEVAWELHGLNAN